MKRFPVLATVGFISWLVLGLACNFPVGRIGSDTAGQVLLQTLQALPTITALPNPEPLVTPTGVEVAPVATISLLPGAVDTPTAPLDTPPAGFLSYAVRSGDTLPGLAGRFGVQPEEILSTLALSPVGYLPHGTHLLIPDRLESVTQPALLLPDGELVYSPFAAGFDVVAYVEQAGGFLSTYDEIVGGVSLSGAEIIQRVANELSVNPRLLLAFLEYRSHWVFGQPPDRTAIDYPIGFLISGRSGLYQELVITATQLNQVYYGWREGDYILIKFPDGLVRRLNPRLNAPTASLLNLLAMFYREADWYDRLYGENGFPVFYASWFGDPWVRDSQSGPLLPVDLIQPPLELPFAPGETWRFSGGPHFDWNTGTPRGAVDFSPLGGTTLCDVSARWATASAPGLVVRADFNAVALDLDMDGYEQTGWVLVYYHLASEEMVPRGMLLQVDDRLGHPSCQGGRSTAAHVHLARKYNGEWLPASEATPFLLSGYLIVPGEQNYQGSLVKEGLFIPANAYGSRSALVTR